MSINKAILIGNAGKDPEVRPVSGNKVANFTLATTEKGYTKQDGTQVPERTEWHNIVAWGKIAEVCETYIRKGAKLYIEGKIRTRSYDDKQGQKRYVTEIFADNMEMLDRAPQQQPQQAYMPPAPQYQNQQPQQQQYYAQPPQGYSVPYGQTVPYYAQQPQQQQPQQPQGDGLPF